MILELVLSNGKISKIATLKAILIDIANIKEKSKSSFGLHVNDFLLIFFKTIEPLAILLHFGFYKSVMAQARDLSRDPESTQRQLILSTSS